MTTRTIQRRILYGFSTWVERNKVECTQPTWIDVCLQWPALMCSTLVFHRLSSTSSRQKQSDDTAPTRTDGLRQTDWTFFSVVKVDRAQTVLSHSIESRTALHVVAVRCNSSPVNNNSCFRSISWCIKAANSSSYWEKEIEMNEWKCFGTMWIVLYSYKCIHALFKIQCDMFSLKDQRGTCKKKTSVGVLYNRVSMVFRRCLWLGKSRMR